MRRDAHSVWVVMAIAVLLAGCRSSPTTSLARSADKPADSSNVESDHSPFQSYNALRARQRSAQVNAQSDQPSDRAMSAAGSSAETTVENRPGVTPLESLDRESLELTRRLTRQVDQHLTEETRQATERVAVSSTQPEVARPWGHGHSIGSGVATPGQQTSATGAGSPSHAAARIPNPMLDPASTVRMPGTGKTMRRNVTLTGVEFVGDVQGSEATDQPVRTADNLTRVGTEVSHQGVDAQPFGPSHLTQQSATEVDAVSWEVELSKLIDLVRSDTEELEYASDSHDDYLRQHVNLRLLQFVARQPEKALHSIPNIDPDVQEFWQQLFWGLSNYFASQDYPDARQRVTFTADDLSRAVQKLRYQALLKVQNMNFCSKINSFGSYDRIRVPRFRASERVLIYAEIENFKSKELIASGKFQTKLSSVIQVYSGEGMALDESSKSRLLHTQKFATTVDLCNRPRRDFFNAYTYILPRDLAPGIHTLVLEVRDELGGSETVERLNFEVEL
ncbi:MAG: hypothetical protein ABGZ17_19230 [Planctomycetaceae bacterium]